MPPEPVQYVLPIPPTMAEDLPAVRAFVNNAVDTDGFVIASEPYIERMEPARIEVDGMEVYPFGEGPGFRAVCQVVRKPEEPQPADLPTFVPHERTVEAIARRIAAKSTSVAWDDMAAVVRNVWMRHALDLVNAAAPFLVADATRHVVNNHAHYGLTAASDERGLMEDVAKVAAADAESQQRP